MRQVLDTFHEYPNIEDQTMISSVYKNVPNPIGLLSEASPLPAGFTLQRAYSTWP
jgi:hypothetical protein